jgi:hypothetical protein
VIACILCVLFCVDSYLVFGVEQSATATGRILDYRYFFEASSSEYFIPFGELGCPFCIGGRHSLDAMMGFVVWVWTRYIV